MEDHDDPLAGMVEAFVQTQGSTLALNFILMEVVQYIARQSGDPQQVLSKLYEGGLRTSRQ